MPEHVYVAVSACLGVKTRHGRLPHFGSEWIEPAAYRRVELAQEVAREWMSRHGEFVYCPEECEPDYVVIAWVSQDHVVWVERLVLDGFA